MRAGSLTWEGAPICFCGLRRHGDICDMYDDAGKARTDGLTAHSSPSAQCEPASGCESPHCNFSGRSKAFASSSRYQSPTNPAQRGADDDGSAFAGRLEAKNVGLIPALRSAPMRTHQSKTTCAGMPERKP